MFSPDRKIIGVFLLLAMLLPVSALAGAGAAQSPGLEAMSANQQGLAHFKHGFYDLTPHGRNTEARDAFARAEKAFLRAVEIDEDFVDAHRNLARLYFIQEKFEQARAQYAQVLRLEPRDVDTYVQIALVATELGSFQDAIQYLEAARKQTGDAEVIRKLDGYIQKIVRAATDGESRKGGGK
jgi:tetratricopeptide (TPR) repeat protein